MHRRHITRLSATFWVVLGALVPGLNAQSGNPQGSFRPDIPKVWDEAALADWVTPVAGLNVRPSHISEKQYYSLAVENLRTYPAYYPGREPAGYWEMLQRVGPSPLIEPDKLKTESDWIEAGRRVFDEADDLHLRTFDPKLIALARSREDLRAGPYRAIPGRNFRRHTMGAHETGCGPFCREL